MAPSSGIAGLLRVAFIASAVLLAGVVPGRAGFAVDARRQASTDPAPALQRARSTYRGLALDQAVRGRTVLLVSRVTLGRPDWVLLETDGTFAPLSPDAAAEVFVAVDGRRVSNACGTRSTPSARDA